MNLSCDRILGALGFCAAVLIGYAQPAAPHLSFVYPAGGQQGTTFTVAVGGQYLDGTAAGSVSGAGADVRVVGYERPLAQKEINNLQEEMQRLQEKRAAARTESGKIVFSPEDEKRVAEIRQLLATRGNRQVAPVLAETVTLEITLAPGATTGQRELRLRTSGGLSNPLVFCIGQLKEISPPVVIATSARAGRDRAGGARSGRSKPELVITLPALVNGQILPGEVDRFRFEAQRGQRLTFAVSARALLPYLADAVPGWFQSALTIFDARGRELAYADDFRFAPDPVVACDIPADGTYFMEIKDALFRGREDFVYRIAVGELPFITSIFPLGGPAGGHASVQLDGWNLPRRQLELDATGRGAGQLLLSVNDHGTFSNFVSFALGRESECLSVEPNDSNPQAQSITLPTTINGRIERPGDEDVFGFEGRAGDTIIAEIRARRLGSPLDSVLTLSDAAGQVIATNDDFEDKGSGLLTHHADSRISHPLPADGKYFLRVADTQRQGGPEYGYRLRVSLPQPDFELRAVPSAINVRAGTSVAVTLYALRHDGYQGDISLALVAPSSGFVLSGATIPAGEQKIQITITAPSQGQGDSLPLQLTGRATIQGKTVVHLAVPADDQMQAFAYRHLVPAKEFRLCVVGQGGAIRVVDPRPLRLAGDRLARVRVSIPSAKSMSRATFELVEPIAGVTVRDVSLKNSVAEVTLACDPAAAKSGARGNLILRAFGERANRNASDAKAPPRMSRVPLGVVPAIPYQIEQSSAPNS